MPEEARLEGGKKVDWNDPPEPTAKAQWSKKDASGRTVKGSFRTICHINRLNNLAVKKFGTGLVIIQPPFNTTVEASAGTHDFDACIDLHIPGVGFHKQQRFLRANGLGCWYRHPPAFGNHIHGFTLPPREGRVVSDDFAVHGFKVGMFVDGGHSTSGGLITSSQLADYYNHAFGLSGQHEPNSDQSWFPENIKSTIFNLKRYIANRAR
jgi:hypothetical protein